MMEPDACPDLHSQGALGEPGERGQPGMPGEMVSIEPSVVVHSTSETLGRGGDT